MKECEIVARVGDRPVTLVGLHPNYLLDFRGVDLGADPLVALTANLPSRSVYLDVGANIGCTVIPVAASRPDIRIIAFEPVPGNAECLRRNLKRNGITNCVVVEAAVGSTIGRTTINEDGPWSRVGQRGAEVPVVTLDSWCREHLPDILVGVVKIDVEGYEPHVLAGAADVMERSHPRVLMEFNTWTLLVEGSNPLAFAQYLVSAFEIDPLEGVRTHDAALIVHDNMTRHGGVFNLTMRPRRNHPPLSLASLGWDRESMRLLAELHAVRSSRSWRITAPLRAVHSSLARWGVI